MVANLPGCQWVLSACGQISALPAGTPSDEALPTGPVYESFLRSNPPVKLLYTHQPCANVNEAASALAGHAVHGDACLVVSTCPGLGASPAALLHELLRPATSLRGTQHQGANRLQDRRRRVRQHCERQSPPQQHQQGKEQQQLQHQASRQPEQCRESDPDVRWSDMARDTVTGIALQLPMRAPQVQAMASVCRGWREAILGHMPLLRRVAFRLDSLSCGPLGGGGGGGTGCGSPSPTIRPLSSPPAAATADGATAAGGTVSSPGHDPPLQPRPDAVQAARGGRAGVESSPDEEEEADVVAGAVLRQYAAGAFLLPSMDLRQCASRAEEDGSGSQDGLSSRHVEAALPAAMAVHAVQPLPRLLVEAAAVSNPSALLLRAQLLEASGDGSDSLRWWRKLAQLGDPMGMFKLGMAAHDGSHGLQPDPEAAHMWLGRTIRTILGVDSLAAIRLDGTARQVPPVAAPLSTGNEAAAGSAARAAAATGGGGGGGGGRGQHPQRRDVARVPAVLEAKIRALDAPRLRMLACSAIAFGYMEFDGVAGPSTWGAGDRSGAVRMFQLAEVCGLPEASAVLGWMYNTGQY